MTDNAQGAAAMPHHDERPTARIVVLPDLPPAAQPSGMPLVQGNLALVEDVKVKLDAHLGGADLSVGELFALKRDSVLTLDAALDAPVELRLGGKLVALGQLVAVDDRFGLRITEIVASAGGERKG